MRIAGRLLGWWLAAALGLNASFARSPDTVSGEEVVRLPAVADAWLTDGASRKRDATNDHAGQFKLKGVEELGLIRFDMSGVRGREIRGAMLFLHRASPDMLRYLRLSTVNQDWGKRGRSGSDAGSVTFCWADALAREPVAWAWPGSTVADVIMSAGNSQGCWAERVEMDGGWIAVIVPPRLAYALAVGDSDGLAVMEGGTPARRSNWISGAGLEGREPHLELRLGSRLTATPAQPVVTAEPAPERAQLGAGAIRLTIESDPQVFCWLVEADGRPIERWRVKHPTPAAPTHIYLEDLPASKDLAIEVKAMAVSGRASAPAKLTVTTSPARERGPDLGPLRKPSGAATTPHADGPLKVWALPALVRVDPASTQVLCHDLGTPASGASPSATANAVWDGKRIRMFGARGEYVSCQLCIENAGNEPLRDIRLRTQPLVGPQSAKIDPENIELYRTWYAKNGDGKWQPAYCVPMATAATMTIPQAPRLAEQKNQTIHVDLYIPKNTCPGDFLGSIVVVAGADLEVEIPVQLAVWNFTLPDRLSFWPELNAYRVPEPALDYYRLAHQHRCVLNCFAWRPALAGSGKTIKVDWSDYDRLVGPMLSGEAFADSRRPGVPVECMYLPFDDSWPTPLSPETYCYDGHWSGKGESIDSIVQHYLTGPYIGNGLSQEYKDAFLAVQRQFIKHFAQMGYNQTEMQCFFKGKSTHRVQYGENKWWTTDEPEYWDDWLALQFFLHLWTTGRGTADPRTWVARADLSRPQWQGRTLNGVVDSAYYGPGGFTGAMARRCRLLSDETGVNVRAYGAVSGEAASAISNVATLVAAWSDGADAFLPWQTLGNEKSLERVDAGADGGAALLVPGDTADATVLADFRLKALRDGQQLVEYLNLLAERKKLSRQQVKAMLHEALHPSPTKRPVEALRDTDSNELGPFDAWQLAELRRCVGELLAK